MIGTPSAHRTMYLIFQPPQVGCQHGAGRCRWCSSLWSRKVVLQPVGQLDLRAQTFVQYEVAWIQRCRAQALERDSFSSSLNFLQALWVRQCLANSCPERPSERSERAAQPGRSAHSAQGCAHAFSGRRSEFGMPRARRARSARSHAFSRRRTCAARRPGIADRTGLPKGNCECIFFAGSSLQRCFDRRRSETDLGSWTPSIRVVWHPLPATDERLAHRTSQRLQACDDPHHLGGARAIAAGPCRRAVGVAATGALALGRESRARQRKRSAGGATGFPVEPGGKHPARAAIASGAPGTAVTAPADTAGQSNAAPVVHTTGRRVGPGAHDRIVAAPTDHYRVNVCYRSAARCPTGCRANTQDRITASFLCCRGGARRCIAPASFPCRRAGGPASSGRSFLVHRGQASRPWSTGGRPARSSGTESLR